jgi:hypothetical protein
MPSFGLVEVAAEGEVLVGFLGLVAVELLIVVGVFDGKVLTLVAVGLVEGMEARGLTVGVVVVLVGVVVVMVVVEGLVVVEGAAVRGFFTAAPLALVRLPPVFFTVVEGCEVAVVVVVFV